MVFEVEEELSHVERVADEPLVHRRPAQLRVGESGEGVFYEVELGEGAGNGGPWVAAESAVGVFDGEDVVVAVGLGGHPVAVAGVRGLIAVGEIGTHGCVGGGVS